MRWIIGAIVLGLGYPVVKYFEIRWNVAQGVNGETGIFYTVYYYLTLTHVVHVFWGLLGLSWVAFRTGVGGADRARKGGKAGSHVLFRVVIMSMPKL